MPSASAKLPLLAPWPATASQLYLLDPAGHRIVCRRSCGSGRVCRTTLADHGASHETACSSCNGSLSVPKSPGTSWLSRATATRHASRLL
ncbi:hypothetical protein FB451DRAFT_41321 [Mycena latifolia]|nr:hypothetical protein FB451DRAFT_41321 [Mycena latifolia]